jgi:archaellum component FlaG (FlaF/FlaG flagellin family)
MGSTPIGHMIFYIALFIIVMIAIYALIQTTITQVSFWILRPSEMAAMDLVGAVTSLGGTTGDVKTDFRTYTSNVTYYVKTAGKVLCMISQREQKADTPIIGALTTFNCYSMPFDASVHLTQDNSCILEKSFEGPFIDVSC